MNGSAGTGSSCLAITEKKAHSHRPGGCVGIFFKLFDWNRRFTKKKQLLSTKLLPPARAKQAAKKFVGDEKMPKAKLHLIADENSGGFPYSMKNRSRCMNLEQKNEMRSPSLVARLMGLESMPTIARDKHSKTRCEDLSATKGLNLGKGCEVHEFRPQKFQKTGPFESMEVTKFRGEALQIRNVLSQSRKQHHPKLASPVRSPRFQSGKSSTRTSRLIEAATKILEPGLQNTNRAKNALTYSRSMHYPPKNKVRMDRADDMSSDQFNGSSNNVQRTKAFKGQSCKSCDKVLDHMDLRSSGDDKQYVFVSSDSDFVDASREGSGMSEPSTKISSIEEDSQLVYKKIRDTSLPPLPSQMRDSLKAHNEKCWNGAKASEERLPFSSQPYKLQKYEPSFIAPKASTHVQNQMAQGRERIPFSTRQSNLQCKRVSSVANAVNGEKDYVSLNRSLSGHPRPRVTTKPDNSTFGTERKSCSRQDYTLTKLKTPVWKRTIVKEHAEGTHSMNLAPGEQKNIRHDVSTAKEVRLNTPRANRSSIRSRSISEKADGSKNSNVISFTFSSPLRQKPGISTEAEENRNPIRKLMLEEDSSEANLSKELPFSGDALGALLEQKLKELTNHEEEEMETRGPLPKRSTAMILQELIYALTAEQLVPSDVNSFNGDTDSKASVNTVETTTRFSPDVDHLSPGSVLDAEFSIDSGFSNCLDDSSESKLATYSLDYSYNQLQPLIPDADILDSATSLKKIGYQILTDLVDRISAVLQRLNLASSTLMGSKFTHAIEVILNAELLFGCPSQRDSSGITDFLTDPFFLNKLKSVVAATFPNYMQSQMFEETKVDHLSEILFDIVIECLDTKYVRYCNLGYEDWRRIQLGMVSEFFIREVHNEMRRWKHLVGKLPDEIIERDMSFSLGKWTDFKSETYETGAKISSDIIQGLVEEIVSEFFQ